MTEEANSLVEDFFKSLTPNHVFGEQSSPDAPDYSLKQNWAALPGINSKAELTPASLENINVNKEINCFFVHPTGFFLKDWNFDLNKETATFQRTELMLATQASAFNGISNIYAPQYRQATFAAISTNQHESSINSLELAYLDVKNAFEYFLFEINKNKPFILASHSQGSLHAQRLLVEFTPHLKKNMIAAYLIGYPLEQDYLSSAGFSKPTNAKDPQVVIQFQTVGESGQRPRLKFWLPEGNCYKLKEPGTLASANPISWQQDKIWYSSDIESLLMPKISGQNVFLDYLAEGKTNGKIKELWFPNDQEISAKLSSDGLLETKGSSIDRILKRDISGMKDLHIWDYQIFWGHIRKNAEKRAQSFLGK